MSRHPGGEAHTRRLLELAALPAGARVLDLGAGAGEAVQLMRDMGFAAEGIDLAPRSALVRCGDLLHAPWPDAAFDAVLSQCAFFLTGDVPAALREARRLLKPGGLLLLSDVFFAPPAPLLEGAGFALLQQEDLTPQWREYYIDAIWRGDAEDCCALPRGKCSYWLLIGRKE